MTIAGVRHDIETLLLGVGAVAETRLAEAAGLACDDGVLVDAFMRSSDPRILAIGDCARFPAACGERNLRLESVQNAHD
jgi:3-phenylpropionate/trans-cinnamate dioxygenase ferredoxin reductase subunit